MMTEQGAEFSEALTEAQRTGLAEANPALDIEGHDAAHKLACWDAGLRSAACRRSTPKASAVSRRPISPTRELGSLTARDRRKMTA
jgi:homoserine dehydrogenase